MKKISRRNILKIGGVATTTYVISVISKIAKAEDAGEKKPWNYMPLDPQSTAEIAYQSYHGHGCMYAVAKAIIQQLAEKYGAPYDQFPLEMLNYGHGGAGGFGSLCGSINGGALAIGLFCRERNLSDQMISTLFQWYEKTALPVFVPAETNFNQEMPQVVTNSVLCHASISNWCMEARVSPKDPFRTERCKRLSADVAAKVVEILNSFSNNEIAPFALDAENAKCMECHGVEEALMFRSTTSMSCNSCHQDPHN